ncbi:MAG TPA: hypothetical protein VG797_08800, partial [Phycisphaerales bacterium]|nr:hypothetical protein [Phycisphaerales bacterium]
MSRPVLYARLLAGAFAVAAAGSAHAAISRDINSYVLFAYDELVFKGGSSGGGTGFINGGNIGVNYAGRSQSAFSLEFATSGQAIMSVGSQAVADSVRSDASGSFFDLYANTLNPSFAGTIRNSGPTGFSAPIVATGSLPTLPFTPGRALTDGASNLTVGGSGGLPSPQTITPGTFRDVRFNDNTVINLGAGEYDLRNLSIGRHVTINVTDQTVLRIDRRFDPNDFLLFGTNAGHNGGAQILVGGFGDNPTTERTTNFSHNAIIH